MRSAIRFVVLLVSALLFMPNLTSGQEPQVATFTIPDDLSPQQLLDYAQKTLRDSPAPANMTQREALNFVAHRSAFLIAVADVALKRKPDKDLLPKIYMLKYEGMQHMARMNDPNWVKKMEDFLDEMDRVLPKSRETKMARAMDLQRQIAVFLRLKPTKEEYERIKAVFLRLIEQEPLNFPPGLPVNLIEVSRLAEQSLETKGLAEATGKELVEMLKKSRDPGLRDMVAPVTAAAHLPGQTIAFSATTTESRSFNMLAYRGKIVLLEFFTSWCVPCIQEIPQMKELLEKYQAKGFEIIGVGIDEVDKVREMMREQEVTWPVLSEELTVKNRQRSLEKWYGIRMYPTTFLIDRDGKLIATDLRGERLAEALERIFREKEAE